MEFLLDGSSFRSNSRKRWRMRSTGHTGW